MKKITKTQREILVHLRDGGRLNRDDRSLTNIYRFVPDRGRIILQGTLLKMQKVGLIGIGHIPSEGLSSYVITDVGKEALRTKCVECKRLSPGHSLDCSSGNAAAERHQCR